VIDEKNEEIRKLKLDISSKFLRDIRTLHNKEGQWDFEYEGPALRGRL